MHQTPGSPRAPVGHVSRVLPAADVHADADALSLRSDPLWQVLP